MNWLFFTNDTDKVETLTKQYAYDNDLEFHSYKATREDMDAIHYLFTYENNICIFIEKLSKAPVCDILLKLLEENKKNIHVFATAKEDIKEALKARFIIQHMKDISYIDSINSFLANKKVDKEVYSDVSFYKQLATYLVNNYDKYTVYNLKIVHSIINDFMLATTNINYDYQFSRLKGLKYAD